MGVRLALPRFSLPGKAGRDSLRWIRDGGVKSPGVGGLSLERSEEFELEAFWFLQLALKFALHDIEHESKSQLKKKLHLQS